MRNNSSANFNFNFNSDNNFNQIPPNRNSSSRSLHHRPFIQQLHSPNSPRPMQNLRSQESHSQKDLGDQMRLMKSRLGGGNMTMNSINSKMGENNLFPS